MSDEGRNEQLDALARQHGVSTEFWDWHGNAVQVSAQTVIAVLAALGVDADDDAAIEASLREAEDRPWREVLPPVVIQRRGSATSVAVHVADGSEVTLLVELEEGGRRRATLAEEQSEPREVDGALVAEVMLDLPSDLPLGWHTLVATTGAGEVRSSLVVVPAQMRRPRAMGRQRWGFMTQLYSVRSLQSWGLGDLADLTEIAAWSGHDLGADFLLVNPMHAAAPIDPMEPSPYLPTTRRFVNPLYIRVEDIREIAYLKSTDRALVEWQAESVRSANLVDAELPRDAAWKAKREALWTVFTASRSPGRDASFARFCQEQGEGLVGYAIWCAIAEHKGVPMAQWEPELHDPASDEVHQLTRELAEQITFYMWLQWIADQQLFAAHQAALGAGMAYGIVHDLAVGVHPDGADVWTQGETLAHHVSVGAPPDAFNQQGQNWSQPPLRPDTLARTGYAAYRDMLRTVLRHAGGLRVDHIMGLFRLWWIPDGMDPSQGTYVYYDDEALLGILLLEAQRAGAFVVGEDLGVVEPEVREKLAERGVLGTSILWFEKDEDDKPLEPERWRDLCLATVTTHDLPPTAGYLSGEHVELRSSLGLLTRDVASEREADAAERAAVVDLLQRRALIGADPTERQLVEALHTLLTWTPCRLVGVQLADAVGDRRPQNVPGTSDEYPNWRMPLADGIGRPVLLEDLVVLPRSISLAHAVTQDRSAP